MLEDPDLEEEELSFLSNGHSNPHHIHGGRDNYGSQDMLRDGAYIPMDFHMR